jgi:hypothetical protein
MRRPQLPKFASASAMAAEAHSDRSGHGRGSAVPDVASALTFSGSLLERNSTTGREFAGAARLLCEPTGRKRERFHSRYSAGLRSLAESLAFHRCCKIAITLTTGSMRETA